MSTLRAGAVALLLLCSSVAVVIARDFSLYDLPLFDESQYDDAAIVQAGMDVDHVLENHPALVANLRNVMQGGALEVLVQEKIPTSAFRTIPLVNIEASSLPHPQERRNGGLSEVQTDLEDTHGVGAVGQGQSQRLLQQGGNAGGVRGAPKEVGLSASRTFRAMDSGASPLAAGSVRSTMLRDQRRPPTFGEAGGQRQSRSVAFASNSGQKQGPRGAGRRLRSANEFDFIVAGFPKCGTTSLLKTFALHPEIDMAAQEQCSIAAPGLTDYMVVQKLDATLQAMSSTKTGDFNMKRAFKCPNAMFTYKSIGRLEKHSPSAKLVVGIRHPVHMMQSFYNYRVTEIYERGLIDTEDIPDFLDLVSNGYEPWKLVSLASVRFELFLQQLGKTTMTPEDFSELAKFTDYGYEFAIKPNNFTIFLYTVDQLEDLDVTRSEQLLADMQSYLQLSAPIPPIGHENKNHFVGDSAHPESISICDAKFASIRGELVRNAAHTAAWLRDHFLQSPDVYVANRADFLADLGTWSTDPCDEMEPEENTKSHEGVPTDLDVNRRDTEETLPDKSPLLRAVVQSAGMA